MSSPEAIAAYPDGETSTMRALNEVARAAFDRGREPLAQALANVGLPATATIEDLIQHHRANAGIAVAAQMIGSKMTADREALVGVLFDHTQAWAADFNGSTCKCGERWTFGHLAGAILGVIRDEREVKAELHKEINSLVDDCVPHGQYERFDDQRLYRGLKELGLR